jgi:Flp pilus assembly protein TadD
MCVCAWPRPAIPFPLLAWFAGWLAGCADSKPNPAVAGPAAPPAVASTPSQSLQATWKLADPPALNRPRGFPAADDASCAECHQDIVQAYARSAMSKSWRSIGSGHAHLDLPPAGNATDADGHYRYAVTRPDDRLEVEETVLNPALRWGPGLRVRADYLVGSGSHAVALVSRDGDQLRLLPVAFFATEGRWRMSPGYDAQNVRFARPVAEACIACHASDARLLEPAVNAYEGVVADGISCRRCHGPALEHVRRMRAGDEKQPLGDDQDLVNPARLSAQRANDICLQCHLQGIVSMQRAGRGPFTFRPGDTLADHRVDFIVDTNKPASFGVASHGSRMMESRCYQATGGKLTCIHCHDPHRPVAEFPAASFDAKCQTCHSDQSRLPRDGQHEMTAGCTHCHMPQRSTREGQHLVFTDHWIRRRPEPFVPEPAELRPGVALRLVSTADHVGQDTKLGAALVWLHEAIGPQPELLQRGVSLLEPLVHSGRADREDAFWLGAGLLDLGRTSESVTVLQRLLDQRPDHLPARFRLAQALRKAGDEQAASAALQWCVDQAPHWNQPAEALALAQLQSGQYEDAAATLQAQLQHGESATAQIHLAVALLEGTRDFARAQSLLDRAYQLRPLDPAVQLNLAYLKTRQSDLPGAAVHYRRVLQLDPTSAQARRALDAIERPGSGSP